MKRYKMKVILFSIAGFLVLYLLLGIFEYISQGDTNNYSIIFWSNNAHFRIITLASILLINIGNELVKGTNFTKPPIIAGVNINDSKYVYFDVYKKAKKKIVLCAQNHHMIAVYNYERFEETIRELHEKNVEVVIFMNDPNFLETATMWETVNEPDNYRYNNYVYNNIDRVSNNNYFHQLVHAAENLSRLQEKYDNVKVYVMPHVPISITFIDPDIKTKAKAIMVTNFYTKSSRVRPYYVIKRRVASDLFESYWRSIERLIETNNAAPAGARLLEKVKVTETKSSYKVRFNKIEVVFNKEGEVIREIKCA